MNAAQLILPIDLCPPKIRRHGLQEFHSFPLVSYGKDRTGGQYHLPFRVPAARAWSWPELQYGQTPTSIAALLFDLDRPDWSLDIYDGLVPTPNWTVRRPENGHGHVCYTLEKPVLTGEKMRPTPQAWLARVGEWLALTLRADRAYNSILAHNPMARGNRGRYKTDWLRESPYTLEELGEFIPTGWRRPVKQPATVYGRNDTLFREGMKWSGKPSNWGKWSVLETHLWAMNAAFIEPLDARELAGIVKSIIHIQARNLATGQTQRNFSFIQAARGRKSGAVRYEGSTEQARPWEAAGVSRRTWYRHQAGQHTGQHGGDRRSANFK